MPEISRFFGIVIRMFYDDHAPPHFTRRMPSTKCSSRFETLAVLRGRVPRRAHALILEWAALHRAELEADWELARKQQPLTPVAPLE